MPPEVLHSCVRLCTRGCGSGSARTCSRMACPLTKTEEQTYVTDLPSEEGIPGIVRRIVEAGGNIYRVEAERPSLEDIYFALTAEEKEKTE